jgi:hypothetical protein
LAVQEYFTQNQGNLKHIAFRIQGSGGRIGVLELDKSLGRRVENIPAFEGGIDATEFCFCATDDNLLIAGNERNQKSQKDVKMGV